MSGHSDKARASQRGAGGREGERPTQKGDRPAAAEGERGVAGDKGALASAPASDPSDAPAAKAGPCSRTRKQAMGLEVSGSATITAAHALPQRRWREARPADQDGRDEQLEEEEAGRAAGHAAALRPTGPRA